MDLLRHYPIHPGSCFILYGLYLVPVGLLIVVLQRSSIQSNCKVILTVWAIGMVGIPIDEMFLMYVNMTLSDGEFISKNFQNQPQRLIITVVHTVFYNCMSALEFLFALAYSFATRSAHSNAEPRSIYWYLVLYEVKWSAIATYTAKLVFIEFNIMIICFTFITVEISSLIINFTIYMYCKRRYVTMFGRSSLTERYQVGHARFEVTKSSIRTLFQFSTAVISWIYAFYYEQIPYFVLEFFYQTLHATNCAVSAILLMHGHPRMQRECLKILKTWY
ncbi:hypothetical protein PENTCL1PPCAC_16919, partial [Pristionchus entomophagus]